MIDAREASSPASTGENLPPAPTCPICKGNMWDNRQGKKNSKSPDFKCRDKRCDGVLWPGQWPPKKEGDQGENATSTDASGENSADRGATPQAAAGSATTEGITADTPVPFGPEGEKGKPLSKVSDAVLRWAIEDGRKLGNRTSEWKLACEIELERRTERRNPTPPQPDDDGLPF